MFGRSSRLEIKLHAAGSSLYSLQLSTCISKPSESRFARSGSLAATADMSTPPGTPRIFAHSAGHVHDAPVFMDNRTNKRWLCDRVPYIESLLQLKHVRNCSLAQ